MEKQKNDVTKNSISEKYRESYLKKLDDAQLQKIAEQGKDSGRSLYNFALGELDYIFNTFILANQDLEYITNTCEQMKVYGEHGFRKLMQTVETLQVFRKVVTGEVPYSVEEGKDSGLSFDDETDNDIRKELRQLKKYMRKMKLPMPSKMEAEDALNQLKELNKSANDSVERLDALVLQNQVPRLHRNPAFENTSAFKDIEVQYNALSLSLKLCLLCFSVFPAGAIIKKRLMVYWWIAEGFIEQQESDQEKKRDLEQLGAEYFDELIKRDFIKPYHSKRRLEVETCKMPSFTRFAVISIAARAKFFDFNSTGRPEANCSSSFRSALFEEDHQGIENNSKFEKFHVVFNVSEKILDIKPEWIQRMKNVVVLYLGRWQSIGNYHIEVDEEKFLEALGHMKYLKLLSLQGISTIVKLPDQVTKLGNLIILDLRACHNLEKIPREIGLLKSLTHLDLSECYSLERIPKGLSKLKNLLVLKGFAVLESSKHSCSLKDLSKLPKLRKLSISTNLKEFPHEEHLTAFQQLTVLTKLKVVWGGGAKTEKNNQIQNTPENDGGEKNENNNQIQNTPENDGGAKNENNNQIQNTPENDQVPNQDNRGSTHPPEPATEPELADKTTPKDPQGKTTPKDPQDKTTPSPKLPKQKKWSCMWSRSCTKNGKTNADSHHLPAKLEKLELQCFPKREAPDWLNPTNLKKLEKLYIRGGELCELGGNTGEWNELVNPWGVKTLRLKYLTGLAMNWKEVNKLFPKLDYLEKVSCPQLTFFPCDEAGVWIKKQ